MSFTSTFVDENLQKSNFAPASQMKGRRLTFRDSVKIIRTVFAITVGFRGLLVWGLITSVIRAGIFITYEWPMQTLIDTFTNASTIPSPDHFVDVIVTIFFMWIVCRWSHDYLLTTAHDWIRLKVEAHAKADLSLQVVDGLRHPEALVEKNMQSSVQSSREQFPAIILAVMSDSVKVLLGFGFLGYFIYLAPSAPYFALSVVFGLCLSATIAYFTGQLTDQFDGKQEALDRFQDVENDVHEKIRRSKSGITFIFKNKIWRGQKDDIDRLRGALDTYTSEYVKTGWLFNKRNVLRTFAFEVTRVISLGFAAWYASTGHLSFGAIIVLNSYIGSANDAIGLVSNLQGLLLNGRYFVEWFEKVTALNEASD